MNGKWKAYYHLVYCHHIENINNFRHLLISIKDIKYIELRHLKQIYQNS